MQVFEMMFDTTNEARIDIDSCIVKDPLQLGCGAVLHHANQQTV